MKFKKIISSALALCMSLCIFAVPSSANSSNDPKSNDAVEYIETETGNQIARRKKPYAIKAIGKNIGNLCAGTTAVVAVGYTFSLFFQTLYNLINGERIDRSIFRSSLNPVINFIRNHTSDFIHLAESATRTRDDADPHAV